MNDLHQTDNITSLVTIAMHSVPVVLSLPSQVASYVCFQADEGSEYFQNAGFEVGLVLQVPTKLTSDQAEVYVEYHQFDE